MNKSKIDEMTGLIMDGLCEISSSTCRAIRSNGTEGSFLIDYGKEKYEVSVKDISAGEPAPVIGKIRCLNCGNGFISDDGGGWSSCDHCLKTFSNECITGFIASIPASMKGDG